MNAATVQAFRAWRRGLARDARDVTDRVCAELAKAHRAVGGQIAGECICGAHDHQPTPRECAMLARRGMEGT